MLVYRIISSKTEAFHDAAKDSFSEIAGECIVLGVVEDFKFQEQTRQDWDSGSVILIGTGGIREARKKKRDVRP